MGKIKNSVKKVKKFWKRRLFIKSNRLVKRLRWRRKLRRRLKSYNMPRHFFKTVSKINNKFLWLDSKKYAHKLNIRISPNNVYCTLVCLKTKKTLLVGSAGKFRVRMSKKLLRRYALDRILKIFFLKVERLLTSRGIIIYLVAPLRTRKRILKMVLRLRKYIFINRSDRLPHPVKTKGFRAVLIKFFSKKIFNGCRPPKKKRKKRKN